ncbi:cyclic pyranopterin monophosphate synthase MoaC [archaeon SCG-AAA382B04]|nr:cyclic pyranopterin monophosphate synthase MoaC [archaeon SCG-AAA382B04]
MMNKWTHLDEKGKINMVDITEKPVSYRKAVARGEIKIKKQTTQAISENQIEKGNVLATARIAAIEAIKNTPNQIPLCHNIPITDTEIGFNVKKKKIEVKTTVKTTSKTGVEMEALNGLTTALLTIWDMVKSREKDKDGQYPHTKIDDIKVLEKVKKTKNDA